MTWSTPARHAYWSSYKAELQVRCVLCVEVNENYPVIALFFDSSFESLEGHFELYGCTCFDN